MVDLPTVILSLAHLKYPYQQKHPILQQCSSETECMGSITKLIASFNLLLVTRIHIRAKQKSSSLSRIAVTAICIYTLCDCELWRNYRGCRGLRLHLGPGALGGR
ncbi:hypothetical protein GDO78_017464 [Eleutherodactylus coqui]|uniref:Uncharacterized protein n=1 Tax=Eleutherodactylus coqui TaxID=57060 RepID=A0A8J6E3G7_ELECQ|nr:hypothetical protein GDO78_017464 [Eleutherodactylus coqui]